MPPGPAADRHEEEEASEWRERIRDAATKAVRLQSFQDVRDFWGWCEEAGRRGEFETTADVAERLRRISSKLLCLDLEDLPKGSGATVTRAKLKRANEARTERLRYDMDRRALRVRVASGFGGPSMQRIEFYEETTSSKYEGSNAFGVKATVDRMVGDSYIVDFRNLADFVSPQNRIASGQYAEDWYAEIPIDPENVRSRLDCIRALAVVTPDPKLGAWVEPLRGDPTIHNPFETELQLHIASCWIEALVLYDSGESKILQIIFDPKAHRSRS